MMPRRDNHWDFPGGFTTLHPHSAFVGSLYYGGLIGFALLLLVSFFGLKNGWINGKKDGEWLPLILLIFGIFCLIPDGIDLLRPSVCWMGDHRTLILEFPLPEAVSAIAYHIFGPSHIVARWVTLAFFLGSTVFLFLFVRSITDHATAKLATVISMILPLALFYSRAVHIDYSALFFAYAMAWLWTEAIKKNSALYLWLGSIPAAIALMIKAPYVLPFIPLLIWLTFSRRR